MREDVIKFIKDNKLENCCFLYGFTKNIFEEYRKHDLLVVPSESESCSYTILEAMAAGIPVVATDIEGNRELIHHEISGILFRNIEQLVDYINNAKNNFNYFLTLAENAKSEIRLRHDVNDWMERYFEIFTCNLY